MARVSYIDMDDLQGLGAVDLDLWSKLNASAGKALQPFARTIDEALKASGAPADIRTKIVSRPLDAILDIFDPIEDAVGRAVDRVIARKGAVQNFFGQRRDITRVQAVDRKADASTQNLLRSLRTIDAFMILFWTQPLELAQEMAKEGIDIATDAAQTMQQTAAATGDAIARAAGDAWQNVSSFFSGIDLGELATALGVGAALGLTGAAAAAVDGIIVVTIGAIVTAVGAAITEAITGQKPAAPAPTDFNALIASRMPITRVPVSSPTVPSRASGAATTGPAVPLNTSGPGVPGWAVALGAVAAVGAVVALTRK